MLVIEDGALFKVEQAARILQITMPHIQLLIRAGRIIAHDRDGTQVVSTPELLKAIEDNRIMQELIDSGQELERFID